MVTRQDLRASLTVKTRSRSFGVNNFFTGTIPAYNVPFQGPGQALIRTRGIVFPFTPNISVAQQVEYGQYDVVHTNYQQNAYARTRNPQIQITGVFVSQTPEEAAYTVGVMHFLRVCSKMNFGANDDDRGTPPPVLLFSAYGAYNFQNVPVLIGSFNYVYLDYVEVETGGETVQIPSMMIIAIDLLPQYSPEKQTNQFTLDSLARGSGYRNGFI